LSNSSQNHYSGLEDSISLGLNPASDLCVPSDIHTHLLLVCIFGFRWDFTFKAVYLRCGSSPNCGKKAFLICTDVEKSFACCAACISRVISSQCSGLDSMSTSKLSYTDNAACVALQFKTCLYVCTFNNPNQGQQNAIDASHSSTPVVFSFST
jgi:hypothetical protein